MTGSSIVHLHQKYSSLVVVSEYIWKWFTYSQGLVMVVCHYTYGRSSLIPRDQQWLYQYIYGSSSRIPGGQQWLYQYAYGIGSRSCNGIMCCLSMFGWIFRSIVATCFVKAQMSRVGEICIYPTFVFWQHRVLERSASTVWKGFTFTYV